MKIKICRLDKTMLPPTFGTAGAAGIDLMARESGRVELGKVTMFKTGIALELPHDYVGLVVPRSGMAVKLGITVVNSPGVIDSDYRGEVMVPLIRLAMTGVESSGVAISRMARIAQLLIMPVASFHFLNIEEVDTVEQLTPTARGTGGFGSTGR